MLRPSFMTRASLAMTDCRATVDVARARPAPGSSCRSAACAPGRPPDGRGARRDERVASDASPRYRPRSTAWGPRRPALTDRAAAIQEDVMRRRSSASVIASKRAPVPLRATGNGASEAGDPAWKWEEARWRGAVNKVRAGRSLKPARWKNGARVCVALSFDSDHETSTLREGSTSPGRLAQGEYGARAGVPRILDLLRRHDLRASFFVPGVVAKLHPDEPRRVVAEGHEVGMHGWIHEGTSELTEIGRDTSELQ